MIKILSNFSIVLIVLISLFGCCEQTCDPTQIASEVSPESENDNSYFLNQALNDFIEEGNKLDEIQILIFNKGDRLEVTILSDYKFGGQNSYFGSDIGKAITYNFSLKDRSLISKHYNR